MNHFARLPSHGSDSLDAEQAPGGRCFRVVASWKRAARSGARRKPAARVELEGGLWQRRVFLGCHGLRRGGVPKQRASTV